MKFTKDYTITVEKGGSMQRLFFDFTGGMAESLFLTREITGYLPEPWHVRYVGTEHSLKMRDFGLCLEEYIDYYGSN